MSRFWRVISWSGGLILVAAGTLLLMGSLRNSSTQTADLEQARLESLARSWETRLENTRLFFHDQIVQNSVLDALEHPEDWSDWRLKNKLDALRNTWAQDNGSLRGMVLITTEGTIYTTNGDTSGIADAAAMFRAAPNTDVSLLTAHGSELLALQYRPAPADQNNHPGHAIALIDAGSVFSPDADSPTGWSLLSGPSEAVTTSASTQLATSVSNVVWPLLLSQKSGAIKEANGSTLCFVRLHLPGMDPLLLVKTMDPRASSGRWLALVMLAFGVAAFSVLGFKPRPLRQESAVIPEVIPEEAATADPTGFRQIFQALDDPVWVVNTEGHIVRANRSAQEWLHLNKGKPAGEFAVHLAYGVLNMTDFLARAIEDPATASGTCRVAFGDSLVEGTIAASRLSRDEQGRGPVLIHFHRQADHFAATRSDDHRPFMPPAPALVTLESVPVSHDSHCPFPVLSVTSGGLITSFNQAARQACPKLEETPLLSEVLAGFESNDLNALIGSEAGTVFESLFGTGPHEFQVVHAEGQILLYGHKLSASKKLEVELKQAQESFYTMCALSPAPVLLVDPRDHVILEANNASADLFGFTPVDLRGRNLDSLAAEAWDFAAGEDLYLAASTSGASTQCLFRYELIKIEGMPTLLVVLEPVPVALTVSEETMSQSQDTDREAQPVAPPAPSGPPPMPIGPGLLITLNPTVREVARRLFEKVGHPCEVFSCLDDATVWLITHDMRPEFAAIDMTDFDDGETWLEEMRARCGQVPCVAFTDGAEYELPAGGANELLSKPFDLQSLSDSLTALHLETAVCESA